MQILYYKQNVHYNIAACNTVFEGNSESIAAATSEIANWGLVEVNLKKVKLK